MAEKCHKAFCDLLHTETGARVWTVREILQQLSKSQLRSLVIDSSECKFEISPSTNILKMKKIMRRGYFDYSLSKLSRDHLIDLLMLHPSVTIKVDISSTGLSVTEILVYPLSNFICMGGQQIVTAKGVAVGLFAAEQRSFENDHMEIVWKQLGVNPIGRIRTPEILEGGDCIPIERSQSMIGVGLRTNMDSARQLMRDDILRTEKVVIVEDVRDRSQDRSHFDTIFAPIDDRFCICLDKVAQDDPRFLRIAREFVWKGGTYVEEDQMPFGKWLRNEGFTVVMASLQQQKDFFFYILHLGKDSKEKAKI